MAYNHKKYVRINWRDSPSSTTPLGERNLNKMDVFLNEVDNALIEMEAGKLNIATANSMIASIVFDKDTGTMTVRQLDGTTFTFDWNVEKIPVSFSLAENGILTMTTQDGTQFTANIADLIKDYVFDDSDTIAFDRQFRDGSYHVSALVKRGSIKEEHLEPKYRQDIENYKNEAQTAANDALGYSQDSKRWAVGDEEYVGSEIDNAKYYKEKAEEAKEAAENARDEAQAATGNVVMGPGRLGVGKPDDQTIFSKEDGSLYAKLATYSDFGVVKPDGDTIESKEGVLKTILKIIDTNGVVGNSGEKVFLQEIIDSISNRVLTKLVSNENFQNELKNYVQKSMLSSQQVNDENKVPTSALSYAMNNEIQQNKDNINKLNTEIEHGVKTLQSNVEAGGFIKENVFFNHSFKKIPNIVVSSLVDATNMNLNKVTVHVGERRIDGFTVIIQNGSTSPIKIAIEWIAISI